MATTILGWVPLLGPPLALVKTLLTHPCAGIPTFFLPKSAHSTAAQPCDTSSSSSSHASSSSSSRCEGGVSSSGSSEDGCSSSIALGSGSPQQQLYARFSWVRLYGGLIGSLALVQVRAS